MVVGDAHVFPGFLTLVLTQLLSKATNYFSHMLQQRWEVEIHRKESSPQPGLESQPPGHESDTLTTEPLGRGLFIDKLSSILITSETGLQTFSID